MGEVWKARDTRLDRSVAIKILPVEFAADAELRIRFQREAKTIAHLGHPHICSLFDVGENYLVMELLDGEPLDSRLERGPLPVADVLKYGAQIAGALDRAHRANIVHRDLKPANVMITKSGAKLLDFGLARTARADIHADSTTQLKLTQEGMIVGTLQYMAPEQFGQHADHRTDIFALGMLLYEMLTGRPAFQGDSRTALAAAIVSSEPPPVSQLQPRTPPALAHVIEKCLAKEPDERWQSAHDIAEELRWIAEAGSQSMVAAPLVARKKSWERMLWIAALLVAIGIAAWLALRPRPPERVIETEIVPEGNRGLQDLSGPPALSPDGMWLVYAADDDSGRRSLWLRSMEHRMTRQLPGTSDALSPFWSPDGRYIGFSDQISDLKKIAVSGGEPETLAKRANGGGGWNRDDVILYVTQRNRSIYRVRASGGESQEVLAAETIGCDILLWPTFLPDGNHFLVIALGGAIAKRGQQGVWVATLDQREKPRFLTRANANATYAEPGFLLYALDGILRAQPFDAGEIRVTGGPVSIAPVQSYSLVAHFTASSTGLLVYQAPSDTQLLDLLVKNRRGEVLRKIGKPAFYFAPRVSPDGKRIAADISNERGKGDIWIIEAADGTAARFSFDPLNETAPVWSPRGDEIIYSIEVPPFGTAALRKEMNGSPRAVREQASLAFVATDWSPDGRYLAVTVSEPAKFGDQLVWSFETRKLTPIASTPGREAVGSFSPDGKWIVYQSDESGRREIYVQPFPPTGAKYQVSTNGGVTARWRRGEIFWIDEDTRVNVAAVTTEPSFRASPPAVLFPVDQRYPTTFVYDVMPDGNILVCSPVRAPAKPMTLVVNWWKRLEK